MTTENAGRSGKRKRSIIVVSDLHCGSTVGLWPDQFRIADGAPLGATIAQHWLLDCWGEMINRVKAMRPKPVVVFNGDVVQGVNMKDGQLSTNLIDRQAGAAKELLKPLVDATDRAYMVRGTEWHEGKASEQVEQLAEQLHCVPNEHTGEHTRWELHLDCGGPVVHLAHHVGVSSVPWYEATVPLRDTLLELSELWRFYGANAPDVRVVVRSHRHRCVVVQVPPDIQVAVTPGWQLKTAFSYKKASSMLPEVGWIQIDVEASGELVVRPRVFQLPPLPVEVL